MFKDTRHKSDSELIIKAQLSLAQKILNKETGVNIRTYEQNKH